MNTTSSTTTSSATSSPAGTEVRPVAGIGMVANPRRTRV
ncbi:hypothetical protein BKA05_001864 [Nocardioides marinus]|uniref:Uncharacterized protein n=1 Tax=Nocardioides marinus TaxID=374514 RepID=A0A7Y9YET5_9ACTN|nr:hypothetical protein [Nocardioides marinus]